jgi:hypothetical protein
MVPTGTKGLLPGTKGLSWVNSKGEHLGFCHMWYTIEMVRDLHARQEVLDSNLTHHRRGLLGFKLFF